MGGPLLAGVTVVALSSLAPMALPLGMRGLAISEFISLYGGLAVFGGFVLYECVCFQRRKRDSLLTRRHQYSEDIASCPNGRAGFDSSRSHKGIHQFRIGYAQHLVRWFLSMPMTMTHRLFSVRLVQILAMQRNRK
jgi:hypothetical protein